MLYLDFDYFKGPFDLLIDLCSKNKIEINTINVEQIINIYLNYINKNEKNFNMCAQYLVLSSNLVELKTRILLKMELLEEQKFEIEDFINSLLEYKKYQLYSKKLKKILENNITYIAKEKTHFEKNEVYSTKFEQNQKKLISIYEKILEQFNLNQQKKQIKKVNLSEISLQEVTSKLKSKIQIEKSFKFSQLTFETKIELIVTFLALLELTNTQLISLKEIEGDLQIEET